MPWPAVPDAFMIGDFNATEPTRVTVLEMADDLLTYRDTPATT